MSSSPEFLIQLLIIVLAALTTTTITLGVPPMSLPNCSERCGNVEIPYPFGTSEGCFLSDKFSIHCNDSLPFIRNSNSTEVTNISLIHGEFGIMHVIARVCYHGDSVQLNFSDDFHISYGRNKFTAVGCDIYAVIEGYRGERKYTTGCITSCDNNIDTSGDSCSGVGCCHTSIPSGLKNITVTALANSVHKLEYNYNHCSYAFVVQDNKLKFSRESFRELNQKEKVPILLTWAIGEERCNEAKKNRTNYACKANSKCVDAINDPGYLCQCLPGYEGNPYLPHGCKDIDECKSSERCGKNGRCRNLPGTFTCICRKGYRHQSKMGSEMGCTQSPHYVLYICIPLGVCITLGIGSSLTYSGMKKRKAIKLGLKFFEQNGGLMLQQKLSSTTSDLEGPKIFSADELKGATNNYHENRVVGRGRYGKVYKGTLPTNKVVAIKKSKFGAQRYNEQFINEVVQLFQINHRNVVKLLGCCLETKVPLLVYEFISNGTLYEHIHNKDDQGRSPLSWELRLKITTETAGALAYLHSATSTPIIHRDVKTGNILLDENFTAKVSDFGASRLIPPDQNEVSTVVQGTFGYLDPEYMQSNQLTEKSDVYSFGVVLAELLTGKKVLSSERPEEERSLAMLFVSAMKDDRLLQIIDDDIIVEGNVEALKCVANLTERCLRVKSEERPTMKEVEMELEGVLRTTEMHQSGDVLDLCVEQIASDPSVIDAIGSISLW